MIKEREFFAERVYSMGDQNLASMLLKDEFSTEWDGSVSRIQEIYENFTRTAEYNKIVMSNEFSIEWLSEKLEDFILSFSMKNDSIMFELGFKYAWSLFSECMVKNIFIKSP